MQRNKRGSLSANCSILYSGDRSLERLIRSANRSRQLPTAISIVSLKIVHLPFEYFFPRHRPLQDHQLSWPICSLQYEPCPDRWWRQPLRLVLFRVKPDEMLAAVALFRCRIAVYHRARPIDFPRDLNASSDREVLEVWALLWVCQLRLSMQHRAWILFSHLVPELCCFDSSLWSGRRARSHPSSASDKVLYRPTRGEESLLDIWSFYLGNECL